MRHVLRLFHRRPEPKWLPLPYEQAILLPEPTWPDYGHMLTAEGRLAVLEPGTRPTPISAEVRRQAARRLRLAKV